MQRLETDFLVVGGGVAGLQAAIAAGGGPHTFSCAGPTTVATTSAIAIGNDVILDGEGDLTVDGQDTHPIFSVLQGTDKACQQESVNSGYILKYTDSSPIRQFILKTALRGLRMTYITESRTFKKGSSSESACHYVCRIIENFISNI